MRMLTSVNHVHHIAQAFAFRLIDRVCFRFHEKGRTRGEVVEERDTRTKALGAELKKWLSMPSGLHQCVLEQELHYCLLGKLMAHVSAKHSRTLIQVRGRELLSAQSSEVDFGVSWDTRGS